MLEVWGWQSAIYKKKQIRNVILTHAHLDHIEGLPLFIDNLFVNLENPFAVHATEKVIDILQKNIFNWEIYPRFSELKNEFGEVLKYFPFDIGEEFSIGKFSITAIEVNHQVKRRFYYLKRKIENRI